MVVLEYLIRVFNAWTQRTATFCILRDCVQQRVRIPRCAEVESIKRILGTEVEEGLGYSIPYLEQESGGMVVVIRPKA